MVELKENCAKNPNSSPMTPSQSLQEGSEKPISALQSPSGVVEKLTTSAPQSPALEWEMPKSPPQSPSGLVELSVPVSSPQFQPVLVENPRPDPPPPPESHLPGWEQQICEPHLQDGGGKQSPPPGWEQLRCEPNLQVGVVTESPPPEWDQRSCEPHLQVGAVQSPPPGWEQPSYEPQLQVRGVTQSPPPGWEKQTPAAYSTSGIIEKSTPFIPQSPLRELEKTNLSSPSQSCLLGREKRSSSTPLLSPPSEWKRKCPNSPLTTEEEKEQSSSFMLPLPVCEEKNPSSPSQSPPPGWRRIPSGYTQQMAPLMAENSSLLQQCLHSPSGLPETSVPSQLPELLVPPNEWENTGYELPLLRTSESTPQSDPRLEQKPSSQKDLHSLPPESVPEKGSNSLVLLGSENKSSSELQLVPPPGWEIPITPPESPPPGWEKPSFPQVSPLSGMEEKMSCLKKSSRPQHEMQQKNDVLESDILQVKETNISQPQSGAEKSAPMDLQIPPLPAPPPDLGQMVCGSCKELLSYPRTARLVKCSCCQMVNFVLEEHEVGNVKCGKCAVLLIYPYGAPSVRCSCCRFVTKIEARNIRPPLSVQQGRLSPASLQC